MQNALTVLEIFWPGAQKRIFEKKRVKVLKGENMHLKLILRIITKKWSIN